MTPPTFKLERQLWRQGYRNIVGLDEVGRGALAGPVVAAAVIFPPLGESAAEEKPGGLKFRNPAGWGIGGLRDSKLLSPTQRVRLAPLIKATALTWSIGEVPSDVIAKIGIVAATERAMLKALNNLSIKPDFHLIDYFQLKGLPPEKQNGVADGDTLVASIAAASVIAKVYRDALLVKYHQTYPQYGFAEHKGYGTKRHLTALRRFGPCSLHRLNFLANR